MESNVIGNPALRACLLLGLVMAAVGCSKLENAVKCRAADPDTRIAGCSALIQAGQIQPENLSDIYSSRGTAYDRKGDHDRAIQDYNEAIQSPDSSFTDPELRGGQPVTNALGMPMPRSGNFADV